eukprot:5001846-Pyramimonas_sp.AAC.1
MRLCAQWARGTARSAGAPQILGSGLGAGCYPRLFAALGMLQLARVCCSGFCAALPLLGETPPDP